MLIREMIWFYMVCMVFQGYSISSHRICVVYIYYLFVYNLHSEILYEVLLKKIILQK